MSLKRLEVWFITGSQHLYGKEALDKVAEHSKQIAGSLDGASVIPLSVVWKPVLTTADAIRRLCLEASSADACVGLVFCCLLYTSSGFLASPIAPII